ncbi:bifunctional glutamate N-acetyltransferase/amino-acid acetyltransferase ArgJ [Lacticaseibacillus daqingensis]|uniref:bifunctional glutamate N-acetyltransferase/amino-acid acetyltransferase ArgJ n=1 Tax=Lacticaseibacillus daqingensis TaxID=2486014 RepID=UPI000F76D463|nr:bifunctional glutamate N-acetyltransferase/amino-acid acetyltransferase ArgJ [Lacticaseibacillus daqingensis]
MNETNTLLWPKGYYTDGLNAGLRHTKNDLGWLVSTVPAAAAGTYTTNQFQAAPTRVMKALIGGQHQLQAIIMNSVCANSCTGAQGLANVATVRQWGAAALDLPEDLVGVASTGVIGTQLPMAKLKAGIARLRLTHDAGVTTAIMTTDTHPKVVSVTLTLDGQPVTIAGFAKGSGMIHPKMATMLGFIFTDAAIEGTDLQALLSATVDQTFNQITVDGDTSTNDMVLALANGEAHNHPLTPQHPEFAAFQQAFTRVLTVLAQGIAADGEGATKLVEVNVTGAATHADAQKVAKAVVGGNLVKAALFGNDPNWGRIMGAIGQTDAAVAVDHTAVAINGLPLVQDSVAVAYDEATVKASMAQPKVTIEVALGVGTATGQAWGCDLTYNYVKINASYRS